MICVSIGRSRHKMMIAEHKALAEQGAELIELRLDRLARLPNLARLITDRPTPVVITCRRPQDGGRWRGTEEQRQTLLRAAIVDGVEYVDLEEDVATKIPRYGQTKRIVSHHDFERTPDDLEQIHQRLCQCDPDVVKLVTTARSPRDVVRVLKLVASAKVPTVGFCMGELGVASRILCGKYGAPFTYATFHKTRAVAPGQLTFQEMRDVYRFDQINRDTTVFGVLGDRAADSFEVRLLNHAAAETGLDAVFVPFPVPPAELKETLAEFEWFPVEGYAVLDPLQAAVLSVASQQEPSAVELGGANVLCRRADGWVAANVEVAAARQTLCQAAGVDPSLEQPLQGKRVLLLGTQPPARAFAAAASQAGAELTVAAPQADQGQQLAEQTAARFVPWEDRELVEPDVFVHCTDMGAEPHTEECPLRAECLRPEATVVETVARPASTLLTQRARERGCRTLLAADAAVHRVVEMFRRLTGRDVPVEPLRRAAASV